jgi:hypothetical protein
MNITMVLAVVARDLGPYFRKLLTDVKRVASTSSNRALSSFTNHDVLQQALGDVKTYFFVAKLVDIPFYEPIIIVFHL